MKAVKYYSSESWKVLISQNYHFLTLPEQTLAMTKGVEINVPNVQCKGEAEWSASHLGALENIAQKCTASQNTADHSDAPPGPQN
jgi:hypothetical protein